MQTYYIDNTSGSVRNFLLIQKHLYSAALLNGTDFDISVPLPWFNGDKESAERLVDLLAEDTHHCIEIYDGEGNIVASTHPVEPTERGNPGCPGEYLCRLEETEITYGHKRKKCWMVLNWTESGWLCNPTWCVIRWLYLPRAV